MSNDTYKCVTCGKTRKGRFTRRRGSSTTGWSQNMHLPHWYCWTCLPAGEGRDETEENVAKMATKAPAAQVAGLSGAVAAPRAELVKVQAEVLAVVPTLTQEIAQLQVTTPEQYQYADTLLGRVRESRKKWEPIWTRIYEKSVKPIREGLEELYQMNRDVEKPHDQLENAIKAKMKAFKREELEDAAAAQRARDEEDARLRREQEDTQRKIEAARTPQMKGKLVAQVQRTAERIEAVATYTPPAPVKGIASGTRSKPKPIVKNIYQFAKGIADGLIPIDCIDIAQSRLDAYYKEDPTSVAAFPGVAIEEDITIVGR